MRSKGLKALVLLLLLGMPVLLYLFLQGFGENEYQVPIFYQQGIPEQDPRCSESLKPHKIESYVHGGPCERWKCSEIADKLVVFSFLQSACTNTALEEIARVSNLYKEQPLFRSVTVFMDSVAKVDLLEEQIGRYAMPEATWSGWLYHQAVNALVQCGLNLGLDCSLSEQLVLVDGNYQIRGYYQVNDPQEMDRLVTEIEILLSEVM